MRKVFINRWFFLAAFLTISLSTFALVKYQKIQETCAVAGQCRDSQRHEQGAELFWDVISRPFITFISIQ